MGDCGAIYKFLECIKINQNKNFMPQISSKDKVWKELRFS